MTSENKYPEEYTTISCVRDYLSDALHEYDFCFEHPTLGYGTRCRFVVRANRCIFRAEHSLHNVMEILAEGDVISIGFGRNIGLYCQMYELSDPECFDKIKDFIIGSLEDATAQSAHT